MQSLPLLSSSLPLSFFFPFLPSLFLLPFLPTLPFSPSFPSFTLFVEDPPQS